MKSVAQIIGIIFFLAWLMGVYNIADLIAAKVLRLKVEEVHLGLGGGRLATFTLGATRFEMSAFLIGGYTKFYQSHQMALRLLIAIFVGPLALLIVGCLFSAQYLASGFPRIRTGGAIILTAPPIPTLAAVHPGDIVIWVQNRQIATGTDLADQLAVWQTGDLEIIVKRDASTLPIILHHPEAGQSLNISFRSLTETARLNYRDALMYSPSFLFKERIGFLATLIQWSGRLHAQIAMNTSATEITGPDIWLFMGRTAMNSFVVAMLPISGLPGYSILLLTLKVVLRRSLTAFIFGVCLSLVIAAWLAAIGYLLFASAETRIAIIEWSQMVVSWSA